MTRQEANKKILELISLYVEKYPEQRFGQIICNYVFPNYRRVDPFFEESTETYKNLATEFDIDFAVERNPDRDVMKDQNFNFYF